jgi:hypothetical protein
LKEYNYDKICDIEKLENDLKSESFDVISISVSISGTIIKLPDTETKNPTDIVDIQ